jgi:GNAT superfamily N-acetyltransferase
LIAPVEPSALPGLARLMADSSLLQRYGVTRHGALTSLRDALAGGDVILAPRPTVEAGFAWLGFAPRILNGAAYLRLLLVAKPGSGLGAQLLSAAEDVARARAANHLYLLATTDNLAARRFYERHGYAHVGDLPGLVLAELDEALYHKRLRV